MQFKKAKPANQKNPRGVKTNPWVLMLVLLLPLLHFTWGRVMQGGVGCRASNGIDEVKPAAQNVTFDKTEHPRKWFLPLPGTLPTTCIVT